jgi:hypothetical protein
MNLRRPPRRASPPLQDQAPSGSRDDVRLALEGWRERRRVSLESWLKPGRYSSGSSLGVLAQALLERPMLLSDGR